MSRGALVLGCGQAGFAAATALARQRGSGAVRVWDELGAGAIRERASRLQSLGMTVTLGPWKDSMIEGIDLVVKSPGVSFEHRAVRLAHSLGVPVWDELELGYRNAGGRPVISVTGTDGKSTVCNLIATALSSPDRVATLAGNTEFGPALSAVEPDASPVVVEVSSYQLEGCSRPYGSLAVLTNITNAHLHRHGTMEAYAALKSRAFHVGAATVPRAALPAAGEHAQKIATLLRERGAAVATFGSTPDSDYRVVSTSWTIDQGHYRLATPSGSLEVRSRLVGSHNALNIAAALAACDLLEVPRAHTVAAITSAPLVPGRWERVDDGAPFAVIVDFAHTRAALTSLLSTARHAIGQRGRVHLVLSTVGHINYGYRPELGAIAGRMADRVVVTEGNSRGEPRANIIADLCSGMAGTDAVAEIVPDRREAITRAIGGARPGDIVLLVDRGAMTIQYTDQADGGRPFDDRVVAREALAELFKRID